MKLSKPRRQQRNKHYTSSASVASFNMAANETTGALHCDPNFAVICSFYQRYSELLGLPTFSFQELEQYIEDTRSGGLFSLTHAKLTF